MIKDIAGYLLLNIGLPVLVIGVLKDRTVIVLIALFCVSIGMELLVEAKVEAKINDLKNENNLL